MSRSPTYPAVIEKLYREHSPRVLATLIRLLNDFSLAEECLQEAFVAALRQWPEEGVPDRPHAWLISTAHRRGIDQIRRNQTARRHAHLVGIDDELNAITPEELDESAIDDDSLRLLFTCCHPALATETRVALTLREMCGLTTEQVAHALLQKPGAVAQRIVRAKRKIRDAGIPYKVPDSDELPQRLPDVLTVTYLVFNEGYSRTDGQDLLDVNLAAEALQLTESLARLLPNGETFGLAALMNLQHSRRDAREDSCGELVTLEHQDRSLWHWADIRRGLDWLDQALRLTPVAPYTLQASIAAEHAIARHACDTNWPRIALLYNALYQQQPSAVIALNRAVAVAMRDSPQEGLRLLEELSHKKELASYHLFHAARADLLRRTGDTTAAQHAYERALQLATQEPERRFLSRQLHALDAIRPAQ